ncbi:hypothetical protein [Marinobacter caseinilyticus]|uniref:hypothetical protein n=1 Tax=Marinobacter caseinilyticus TaxID=2692195 RepID=UPI0014091F1F|nr:hypothetical protein [Marinobacter caseinilyticus]
MALHQYVAVGLCLAVASTTLADVIKSDGIIVQGSLCVGSDCVNGEIFTNVALKLKENNTRIRWHDLSATPGPMVRVDGENTYVEGTVGESWRLDANQSNNGGTNSVFISQFSLTDTIVLSNGSAPDYDCPATANPNPSVGVIAEGLPAENQSNCAELRDFVQVNALSAGGAAASGVALGTGAQLQDQQVSLGNITLKRRLARVALAVAETDALIKSQLDADVLKDQKRRADEIEALLDMVEADVVALEAATSKPKTPFGGGGAATWLLVLVPLLGLKRLARQGRR